MRISQRLVCLFASAIALAACQETNQRDTSNLQTIKADGAVAPCDEPDSSVAGERDAESNEPDENTSVPDSGAEGTGTDSNTSVVSSGMDGNETDSNTSVVAPGPDVNATDPCAGVSCGSHGECKVKQGAGPFCSCQTGYAGADCSGCADNYALHGATCALPTDLSDTRQGTWSSACSSAGYYEFLEGKDRNFNGVLDDDEVTNRESICRKVRKGDAFVRNPSDLEILRGFTDIEGTLTIEGPAITDVAPLERLVNVTAGIAVQKSNALTSLDGLKRLARVGGRLRVADNKSLSTVRFARLAEVQGDVDIGNVTALTELNFGDVAVIKGSLQITDAPLLTVVAGRGRLRSVGLKVMIGRNPALRELPALRALDTVGGALEVSDNASLETVSDLRALRDVGGLVLQKNASMRSLDGLNGLVRIRGNLTLFALGQVRATPAFTALEVVAGDLLIANNPTLERVEGFTAVTKVGAEGSKPGALDFEDNPVLRLISTLPNANSIGRLKLSRMPALETFEIGASQISLLSWSDLPALVNVGWTRSLVSAASIDCELLGPVVLDFAALTGALPKLYLADSNATALLAPKVTSVGHLVIENDPQLLEINLSSMTNAGGSSTDFHLLIVDLPALRRLDLSSVVGGSDVKIDIGGNPELSELRGLGQLVSADRLIIGANRKLGAMDSLDRLKKANVMSFGGNGFERMPGMPVLEGGTSLDISGNPNLTALPNIPNTPANVTISRNPKLTSLLGPRFSALSSLTISQNPSLTSLEGLEGMSKVGTLSINSNLGLTSLSGLKATSVDDLRILDNKSLPQCSAVAYADSVQPARRQIERNDINATCP